MHSDIYCDIRPEVFSDISSQVQTLGNLVSNEVRWCTQSPYRVVLRRNWHNHLETFTWKVGKNMKAGRDRKIKGWNMLKINNQIRAVGCTPMRKYLSQMTGECRKTLSTSHDYSKLYMIGIVPVQINVARMCRRQIMFPSHCLGQVERPWSQPTKASCWVPTPNTMPFQHALLEGFSILPGEADDLVKPDTLCLCL